LAPLPKEPEFWVLIEQLKKELGPEAAAVLGDLVGEASGRRTKELYVALLAGLKDPAAESRLALLASSAEEDLRSRGLAFYGLGLLRTESAWTSAQAMWHEPNSPAGRDSFYPGLALFGERAAPLFFEEAESVDFDPFRARVLSLITGAGSKDRLWELADGSKNESVRLGALQALTQEPDPATLSRLLDHLEDPLLPADRRVDEGMVLGWVFTGKQLSLGSSPLLLDRILAHWDAWPANLKWSLLCDPAVRSAKPEEIDRLEPPHERNDAYIEALIGDSSRQGRLADYAASHPEDDTMMYLMAHLERHPGLSDPALLELARNQTLHFTGEDDRREYWAWRALLAAPGDIRAEALQDVARVALQLPRESDRLKLLAGFAWAGPDAAPVALDLLHKETNPTVRLELLGTVLSNPGHEEEARALARSEIDQILGGVTEPGLRYAALHPEGKEEGIERYGALVRQVFSAYGTPEDIPRIREYSSRMVMPEAFGGNRPPPPNPESWRRADYYRGDLQEEIQNSIDAIRARYPESPGK
jgi:hypothetical protein